MIFGTTNVLHQGPLICLSLLPPSTHRELAASLVCGTALPPGEFKRLFLDTGLIHVMVVSGAHLLFLESLMARLPVSARLPVLGFYCWLTGFGAPVVKAFALRVGELWFGPAGWTRLQTEAVAVFCSVALYPWWLTSRSLQMSWMCALALSLPRVLRWKELDQSLKAYVLLFVFVGSSPLGILWNTLVAPVVGVILFPLSLLLLPFGFLAPLVDEIWDLFLLLLSLGPKSAPAAWFIRAADLFWVPPLLHSYLLIREVRWRRRFAFSRSSS